MLPHAFCNFVLMGGGVGEGKFVNIDCSLNFFRPWKAFIETLTTHRVVMEGLKKLVYSRLVFFSFETEVGRGAFKVVGNGGHWFPYGRAPGIDPDEQEQREAKSLGVNNDSTVK